MATEPVESPFRRIMECYILWVTGHLPPLEEWKLQKITPILRETYGLEGHWTEIVATVLQFSGETDHVIRRNWDLQCQVAARHGEVLAPEAFVRSFVDGAFKGRF